MAAKKAKAKGGARRSGLDGLDPVAQVAALRGRLSGLLERLIAAEQVLADALRDRNGTAPARRPRTTGSAPTPRRRSHGGSPRTAPRPRKPASRGGA